jgi:cell wall-associated NlpC family hydrolase
VPIIQFVPAHEAVTRARTWVGKGKYKLGAGPRSPDAATPFDRNGCCDCSGFATWALGVPRRVELDEDDGSGVDYWNTDGLLIEARLGGGKYFTVVEGGGYLPGDLVVYGSIDWDRDGSRDRVGHVGVIVRGGPLIASCQVVHCRAPRNGKGPAVVETTGDPFVGRARWARMENRKWRSRVIRPVRRPPP